MELLVENMTCGHCVRSVTRALQSQDSQAQVDVDLATRRVRIGGGMAPAQAIAVLAAAGYEARPVPDATA